MRAILLLGQTDMMSTATSAMQQCFRDMQTKILTFLIFFKIKNQKSENMPSLPCKLEMKCWMPAPHRQQLWEGQRSSPAPGKGEEGLKPHKGNSGYEKGGCHKPSLLLGSMQRHVGREGGSPQCPPNARAGCFTFFLPNNSSEKSLLEPAFLHLFTSSLPQPTASSFPHGKGYSILRGLSSISGPVGGQSGGLCQGLQPCSGWRTERVTGAGSAVSVIPWDGKLSLNQRGHLAL